MKILILMLFAAFISMTAVNGQAGKPPGNPVAISFTLYIGKKSAECSGFGICGWDWNANGSSSVSTGPGGGGGGGSWLLTIPREVLVQDYPDQLVNFFEGKTSITFPETTVLPKDISRALGSFKDLIIQGNSTYPLRFENGNYIVTFPLTN